MQIDAGLLSKLENLSALKIDDEKRKDVIAELSEIVNFVEKLNELDLSELEVTVSTLEGGTPLRCDEARGEDVIDGVLACAPKSDERFFVVPKIIE
ncbi:Asp-tRNA(Asn)/Glu-tRNA(Gln) amidotransferase subunit GatC [Campylobacter sp.]|uniref:Asp-tRNA(Asn)/Glu-tRNA(Gln) amidotransferase subunit GatC n=1 Tax=Campylobacter sp. TaxID=205 RepID=UPI0026DCCA81|nr:Asp-tRNA(Asn)/Glu-tRNA(Gln) amidotransferase subunit GatC [Campylobacter sp.]MDO4673626.1 Asp-tRNA(Asn)/Glu-tRNA(Gln) amidotransferase subunit GatC [Campylobacter sp.]